MTHYRARSKESELINGLSYYYKLSLNRRTPSEIFTKRIPRFNSFVKIYCSDNFTLINITEEINLRRVTVTQALKEIARGVLWSILFNSTFGNQVGVTGQVCRKYKRVLIPNIFSSSLFFNRFEISSNY
jgi:hypothetical protein